MTLHHQCDDLTFIKTKNIGAAFETKLLLHTSTLILKNDSRIFWTYETWCWILFKCQHSRIILARRTLELTVNEELKIEVE